MRPPCREEAVCVSVIYIGGTRENFSPIFRIYYLFEGKADSYAVLRKKNGSNPLQDTDYRLRLAVFFCLMPDFCKGEVKAAPEAGCFSFAYFSFFAERKVGQLV